MLIPIRKLYILVRTDMDSMTPGRIAAQASHAANQFVFDYNKDIEHYGKDYKALGDILAPLRESYEEWVNQTPSGFGTVIVLNGGGERDIRSFLETLDQNDYFFARVIDPEYAVKDGNSVHFVENVLTCAYVFPIHYRLDNHELSHLKLL